MRQGAVHTQVQKVAKSHVAARLLDHLPVRKVILVLQELQLEQQQEFHRRASMIVAVAVGHDRPQPFEVDNLLDSAEVMVLRHSCLKDFLVPLIRRYVGWLGKKHITSPSWIKTYLATLPAL